MNRVFKKTAFLILTVLLLKNVYTPVLAKNKDVFLKEGACEIAESKEQRLWD